MTYSIRIISRYIEQDEIDKISSISLLEFIWEWNKMLYIVCKLNEEEPDLNARLLLVLSKTSNIIYSLSREYHEGGLVTIEDTLEIYSGTKAYKDILDIYG